MLPLLLFLLVFAPPASGAERWVRPVPGEVVRPFAYGADPFAAGQHRGADLAASAGQGVRSACAGRVVFAGRVPAYGRMVTVRCGAWRVSYGPLARVAVRRGAAVARGWRLGTAGAGHGGLHLGMRREGRRFGYVDPLPRFGGERPQLGPAPTRVLRRRVPPELRPSPTPKPVAAPEPGVAPWPVWVGLAFLLGPVCGGTSLVRWRRTRRVSAARTAELRR